MEYREPVYAQYLNRQYKLQVEYYNTIHKILLQSKVGPDIEKIIFSLINLQKPKKNFMSYYSGVQISS